MFAFNFFKNKIPRIGWYILLRLTAFHFAYSVVSQGTPPGTMTCWCVYIFTKTKEKVTHWDTR